MMGVGGPEMGMHDETYMQSPLLLMPPPPPPPPPPPSTTASETVPPPPSVQPPLPPSPSVAQPPPGFAITPHSLAVRQPQMIDLSRPPPPLPSHLVQKNPMKRMQMDPYKAGPSKLQKPDCDLSTEPCETCNQRRNRIELYKDESKKIENEEEVKSLIYKKKVEFYEYGKSLLRSMVTTEVYRFMMEYIEGIPQMFQLQDFLVNHGQAQATYQRNLLLQLMDISVNHTRQSSIDQVLSLKQAPRFDDTMLQSPPRRGLANQPSLDVQDFLNVLRGNLANERDREVPRGGTAEPSPLPRTAPNTPRLPFFPPDQLDSQPVSTKTQSSTPYPVYSQHQPNYYNHPFQ